jgi:hypothetical protein
MDFNCENQSVLTDSGLSSNFDFRNPMSSNLTILQIWNLWSQSLIPYFQECDTSLMSDSVQEIIRLYGSNLSLPFQKELSEFLLVQAVQIRSQYESVKTVEKNSKGS